MVDFDECMFYNKKATETNVRTLGDGNTWKIKFIKMILLEWYKKLMIL